MQGTVAGLFMLFMSLGVVAVAIQGVRRGWLPNGPRGFKRGKGVSRADNPIAFWLVFGLYLALAIAGAMHALRLLGRG